jgi:hypothetical protein
MFDLFSDLKIAEVDKARQIDGITMIRLLMDKGIITHEEYIVMREEVAKDFKTIEAEKKAKEQEEYFGKK